MDDRVLRDVLFPLLRRAVNYYFHFLTRGTDGRWHLPFTFSPEYGVNAPDCNYDLVIETPLSAVQSMHDMLCQSWGGVVRVFPAVPVSWPEVSLDNFRTQGAFLLSAARRQGVTRWVRLRSEAARRGDGHPRSRRARPLGPAEAVFGAAQRRSAHRAQAWRGSGHPPRR
ncbi:hypothetical protein [Nocardia sp. NRRL S-836]|uniref:hypothetical protein n=1 Tax=Nocardia sp. NRRL S-836 TaxID=1519492 RepID=UPI0018D03E89|nr:hypothetical protein [Nocardia sp. NRRL S-836]